MNTNDIAIRIEHISKRYDLGVINTGTFFRDMQRYIARKRGKPDPHAQIGNEYFDSAESFWALKDVTFDIQKGDRLGIIGKNGAGKSTLLKLISRISAPTEGIIKINGKVSSLLEVGTGFHKELTGRENIYLNGAILGMKKRKIDKIIDEIIDFSGIERYIDTPVKRYSSGMYVRLGFAVAAHLDSDILIADEVLAVGDASFQQKAIGKMNSISQEQGRTILFVSHNLQAVKNLCNTGILLEKGQIINSGSVEECIQTYTSITLAERKDSWSGVDGDMNLKMYSATLHQIVEGYILKVDYEVFNGGLDYVFAFFIANNEGQRLCVAVASDFFSEEEHKVLCEKGKHSLSLTIETKDFATGCYSIEFDIHIYGLKRITDPNIKLYFEVYNALDNRHQSKGRENIMKPKWQWNHT